jgi:hypothetical protein
MFKEENAFEIFRKSVIDQITSRLNINSDDFFIIPGNHDVDQTKLDPITEAGMITHLSEISHINSYIEKHKAKDHEGIERISDYKKFENEYYKNSKNENYITNFESCHILEIEKNKIGIACLNSAWRCSSELPKENLIIGTKQILDAHDFFNLKKCDFSIALIHHPIDFISLIERQEMVSYFQSLNFDIILFGHTHSGETIYRQGNNGNIFFSISKSSFNNPREKTSEFKPGYTIIDIDLEKSEVTCHFRTYVHNRIEFDKDIELASDGILKQTIKARANRDDFHKLFQLTDKTCKAKLDNINTSLVTYGTNSIAPRDLNSIFVLPKLTDSPSFRIDSDSKKYTLNEIVNDEDNILIVGDKETGKTTLLNKIFIEVSNNFSTYERIPINIDFTSLIKKEMKSIIKDFMNEPSSDEVNNLLLDGKVIVLIDNILDNDNNAHAKSHLRKFQIQYPKVKIIATTSSSIDILLTSDNSLFSKPSETIECKKFKAIYIGSVGVNEFKDLSIKWFKNKDAEWLQLNIQKLIQVFEILRIPRTFFSVSLFLWIIEKQENYKPINRANLVQKFLMFILEGLKLEDAKAGSYNFDKKIELLTEIAYKMYDEGDKLNNYSLTESQAIECIQKNFTLNQLKFSVSDKLAEFIEKGVLKIDQSNFIRFRYESFFQYFLSLNIDKNPVFKAIVFSQNDFLCFVEELDFYTGRQRDDSETLKLVIERLKFSFEEIDKIIDDNIDKYFPNESFILKHINPDNFISDTRKIKLTNEEIEQSLGNQMETLPVDDSIKIKDTLPISINFHKVLELAARVLKNSENIQNPNLVNEGLDLVVSKSAKYGIWIQSVFAHQFKTNADDYFFLPKELLIAVAPLINQLLLLNWIGTDFLEIPIENKIKKYLSQNKGEFSEYELYLVTFLFSDMKFQGHVGYSDNLIDKVDNKFICELAFFKIFLYYMMRPENSSLLPEYEKQMVKLLVKARGMKKSDAKAFVEKDIRKKKNEAQNQLKIGFTEE